jgi:hypothetical protein
LPVPESDRRLRDQIQALKDNERNLTRLHWTESERSTNDRSYSRTDPAAREPEEPPRRRDPSTSACRCLDGDRQRVFPPERSRERGKGIQGAIEVNPTFGEAHSNLAVVYLITGRATEAEAEVKAARKQGFG